MSKKSSNTVWWILGLGCVGCIGIVVLAVAGLGWMVFEGHQDVSPVVEEFLGAVENGRFDEAWEMTGDSWREEQSREQFETFCERVNETLGERHSMSTRGFSYQGTGGGSTVTTNYAVEYDNDDVIVSVTLRKYDDTWKVESVLYDSDLFDERPVCPECGAVNDASARFCSQCGHELESP